MSVTTIKVTVDPASGDWLREFAARMSGLADLVDKPVDLVQLVSDLPRGAAGLHFESVTTGGAGDRRLILKPGNAFLELMSALRAFQGRGNFVAEFGHDNSLSVGSGDATVTESPAGQKPAGDEAKKNSGDMS